MFAVGVAICTDYDRARVREATQRAIDALGGIGAFIRPGERVLVKPNLLYARPAETGVTTHPEVVRSVVELALAAGAREVAVGDSPGLSSTATVVKASGIARALSGTNTGFVEFENPIKRPGKLFPSIELDERTDGTWAIINVAKAKTHVHAGLTLATKNCFGFVPGLRKSQWHLRAGRDGRMFARLVADIADAVAPRLNVVDAVLAMEGNGPGSGTTRPVGRIVAGASPFAVDEAVASLLRFDAAELPMLLAARERDGAPRGLEDVELLGDELGHIDGPSFVRAVRRDVAFSIRLPRCVVHALGRHATPRPKVDPARCRACGACAKICPPQAITIPEGEHAHIDRVKCISCFCCQEICPVGAIGVHQGILARIFHR